MTPDLTKTFVTRYLESLNERTRDEKGGAKWGFDWVIYNLGLALYGKPVRLPFHRRSEADYAKTKTEGEQGIDLSFLSEDEKTLTIFVLKAVSLTNHNWTEQDILRDLQLATYPDLGDPHLAKVEAVEVILAYNKDDDRNGIMAYDNYVANAPKTLARGVALRFARWNLSDLVAQTLDHLLSPTLVPQKFFSQLNYLCAQAADFPHGSDSWEQQLVPAWRRFLDDALAEGGARGASLIPVALIVLSDRAKENRSFRTGAIDLSELAAIALWRTWSASPNSRTQEAAISFWMRFYLLELYQFYQEQIPLLTTPHAIDQITGGSFVGTVAASYVGHWHLGRLGLLAMGFAELFPEQTEAQKAERERALHQIGGWITDLISANVSLRRPVLDIQHIEFYLAFVALWQTGRSEELTEHIVRLVDYLYLRRLDRGSLPFIDAYNSLENVFEQVATQPAEPLVTTRSSYFLLMLLEMCCALPQGQHLLSLLHRRLVLGAFDSGDPGKFEPLDLMSWIPSEDWQQKVLTGYAGGDGEVVSTRPFSESRDADGSVLFESVMAFIRQTSATGTLKLSAEMPTAALILACLRHHSPLPPEMWRRVLFPDIYAAAPV